MNPLIPQPQFALTAECQKLFDALNARWDDIQARREVMEIEKTRLAAVPIEDADKAHRSELEKLRGDTIDVLRAELVLLREADQVWPGAYSAECTSLIQSAELAVTAAVAKIRRAIVEIGFSTEETSGPGHFLMHKVPPSHSAVKEANKYLELVRSLAATAQPDFARMAAEIDKLLRHLLDPISA